MKEHILRILGARSYAYRMVFDAENVNTKKVLSDLAKFCRATQSCFGKDDRTSAVLEGRREVWLRIQNHLKFSEEELYEMYQEGKKL